MVQCGAIMRFSRTTLRGEKMLRCLRDVGLFYCVKGAGAFGFRGGKHILGSGRLSSPVAGLSEDQYKVIECMQSTIFLL